MIRAELRSSVACNGALSVYGCLPRFLPRPPPEARPRIIRSLVTRVSVSPFLTEGPNLPGWSRGFDSKMIPGKQQDRPVIALERSHTRSHRDAWRCSWKQPDVRHLHIWDAESLLPCIPHASSMTSPPPRADSRRPCLRWCFAGECGQGIPCRLAPQKRGDGPAQAIAVKAVSNRVLTRASVMPEFVALDAEAEQSVRDVPQALGNL